jgi:hypothetical protein
VPGRTEGGLGGELGVEGEPAIFTLT